MNRADRGRAPTPADSVLLASRRGPCVLLYLVDHGQQDVDADQLGPKGVLHHNEADNCQRRPDRQHSSPVTRPGLLSASRGRLRDALEVARAIDEADGQATPRRRASAIGAARRELVEAGLIAASRRRLSSVRLIDRRAAADQFHGLLHAIEGGAASERDVNLLLLLATSGD